MELYGDWGYGIRQARGACNLIVGKRIKNGKKENWKILKRIKIDVYKLKKKKNDNISIGISEVTGKNTVIVRYASTPKNDREDEDYGGIIQVNVATGKVKELVKADVPLSWYDGKYVYGGRYRAVSGQNVFYRISLETKKVDKFTAPAFYCFSDAYSDAYSGWSIGMNYKEYYTFFEGGILCLDGEGRIYHATFDSGKFEQIGDISHCKNYKKYKVLGLAMKSKNEFYISYSPKVKKNSTVPVSISYGKVFVAKYHK